MQVPGKHSANLCDVLICCARAMAAVDGIGKAEEVNVGEEHLWVYLHTCAVLRVAKHNCICSRVVASFHLFSQLCYQLGVSRRLLRPLCRAFHCHRRDGSGCGHHCVIACPLFRWGGGGSGGGRCSAVSLSLCDWLVESCSTRSAFSFLSTSHSHRCPFDAGYSCRQSGEIGYIHPAVMHLLLLFVALPLHPRLCSQCYCRGGDVTRTR
mmetsp:Transcript_34983/g.90625  ORF Transcript_34983/g.90625 Transcript_34983/m.90625 type:complete len:209 (-) Transcript_34983:2200-2826(-)